MQIGLFRREHLQSNDPQLIGSATADQFQRTHGALAAWQEVEHTDDGKHTTIHADSLDVAGDAIVRGDLTVLGGTITDIAAAYADPSLDVIGFLRSKNTDSGGTGALLLGGTSNGGELSFQPDPAYVLFDPTMQLLGNLLVVQSVDPTVPAISTNGYVQAALGYKERGRTFKLGEWVNEPYSVSNYAADAPLTFVPTAAQHRTNAYTVIGKTMHWKVEINSATIGGSGSGTVHLRCPGGYIPARGATNFGFTYSNVGQIGFGAVGAYNTVAGGPFVQIVPLPSFSLVPSAAGFTLWAEFVIQVQ